MEIFLKDFARTLAQVLCSLLIWIIVGFLVISIDR